MKALVIVVVTAGLAFALALGIARGFDARSLVVLLLVSATGLLAVAAAGRVGVTGPATCPECGQTISPHAPYCKHCGARPGGSA
ncbi:MAG TPA: zinc ribbon domain-containing protein [Actinomycetota bacterium]|nr:zinc ribbon domain-containing protein [Actinomycetota bacterium]